MGATHPANPGLWHPSPASPDRRSTLARTHPFFQQEKQCLHGTGTLSTISYCVYSPRNHKNIVLDTNHNIKKQTTYCCNNSPSLEQLDIIDASQVVALVICVALKVGLPVQSSAE